MAKQQKLGTVLERQAHEAKIATSIKELDLLERLGMYGIGDRFSITVSSFDNFEELDPTNQLIEMIPYRNIASNEVITSIAQLHILESRVSQAYGLSNNTRWDVGSVSKNVFRPLYRLEKHEFWNIYRHLDTDTFPCVLANRARCTP